MDPNIADIIYGFLPVSAEDEIMNSIYNILTVTTIAEPNSCNYLHTMVQPHLYTPTLEHTWVLAYDREDVLSMTVRSYPLSSHQCKISDIILDRKNVGSVRLPKNIMRIPPSKLARMIAHLVTDVNMDIRHLVRIKPEHWTTPERYVCSLEQFRHICTGTYGNDYGLGAFLRSHGGVLNHKELKTTLVQAIESRHHKPVPSSWCTEYLYPRWFVKQNKIKMFGEYPLTLKRTAKILSATQQRILSRNFKRGWLRDISEHEYHYLKRGSVGHGNGPIVMLTIEGFFGLLRKRARTAELRSQIFELYQFTTRVMRELDEIKLAKKDFKVFAGQLLKRCDFQTIFATSF